MNAEPLSLRRVFSYGERRERRDIQALYAYCMARQRPHVISRARDASGLRC